MLGEIDGQDEDLDTGVSLQGWRLCEGGSGSHHDALRAE